jgi:parallel beta helix pectate lyase-like protein
MTSRALFAFLLSAILGASLAQGAEDPPWKVGRIDPAWGEASAKATVVVEHDGRRSPEQNGAALHAALRRLQPGTRLRIRPGVYSIESKTSLNLRGSAKAPIWIEAFDPRRPPTITRPDAKQNVLNIGDGGRTEYLALRGLVLTGGSSLIRLYDCSQIWIDRCELKEGGNVGITANVKDTDHLFITRNHIHHLLTKTSTNEGMYLGANNGKAVMSYSVIAENHVHDMGGKQGDGIEVKQGSHTNWIVGNHVHDTRYPAIIAYGTAGKGVNVIERNVAYRSADNVLQVQGEARVRNNLVISGKSSAFSSTDHQGKTRDLVVVHNTFVSRGLAVKLSSWSGREGMVFANNLVVSEGTALRFPKGHEGVTVVGNAFLGKGGQGPQAKLKARGLQQLFMGLDWEGKQRDARPRPGALGSGAPAYRLAVDLDDEARSKRRVTPGAVEIKKKKKGKKKR